MLTPFRQIPRSCPVTLYVHLCYASPPPLCAPGGQGEELLSLTPHPTPVSSWVSGSDQGLDKCYLIE